MGNDTCNAPFGWVKDTREDNDNKTLELTTRPFIAQQWREDGFRVVTLYNLPHRESDMPANAEITGSPKASPG